jgi:hypothetical protein
MNSTTPNGGGGNQTVGGSGNPVGSPSPSTAVAMIILYSITGVITALFLVIIITGAIRAHRHPERYGPRAGLGRRPGQSRARGLARAMLDTLPITKFGEREEDKPPGAEGNRDVEMAGGVVEAGGVEGDKTGTDEEDDSNSATGGPHDKAEGDAVTATASSGEAAEPGAADVDAIATDKSQDLGATESKGKNLQDAEYAAPMKAREEDHLGCSICTEDFERGQDVRVLPCHHTFHPACIDPWLLNVSGTCPLCRVDLRPTPHPEDPSSATEPHNTSVSSGDLPPPIEVADLHHPGRRTSRRGSAFFISDIRDILNPRAMRDASAQERIAALRSVRDRGTEEDARRRRRLTGRLQDVFSVRTLRTRSPRAENEIGEGSSTVTAAGPSTLRRESAVEEPSIETQAEGITAAEESEARANPETSGPATETARSGIKETTDSK